MSLNKAYLKAGHSVGSDECLTPFYAVEPILQFISQDKVIWCPFDKCWSAFVQVLKRNGNEVIYSHIDDGLDFFTYEPRHYDIIISNPPFSKKDDVLERCYELGKPFMLLLPANAIQSKQRVKLFQTYGLELLVFDLRVDYHTNGNFKTTTKGCHFGSAYYCRNVLPKQLVFKNLIKYDKPLFLQ